MTKKIKQETAEDVTLEEVDPTPLTKELYNNLLKIFDYYNNYFLQSNEMKYSEKLNNISKLISLRKSLEDIVVNYEKLDVLETDLLKEVISFIESMSKVTPLDISNALGFGLVHKAFRQYV